MRTNQDRIEIEHPYDGESKIEIYGEWVAFTDSEKSTVLIDPKLVVKLYEFMLANADVFNEPCT